MVIMKKTIYYLTIISTITLLNGCDYYTTYKASIKNDTNDTITVFFMSKTAYIQGADTVICMPYSEKTYFEGEGRFVKKYNCNPQILQEEVNIVTSSGLTLTKNIWEANNWEYSGSNKKGWKETFVITEDDLE
jgi:hypothetical protein